LIGTNKTSRNGSQLLELHLLELFETFEFPFDAGDHRLRSGVSGSFEDAIEFHFTSAFKLSQGGNTISNESRRSDPHDPATILPTAQAARAFLGGDQAIAEMGFFLRALSSLYAVADCQRLVDEMIDRLDWYQPVDLPSIHCTFALNGAGKNGNAAKVAKVRAEVRAGLVKLAEELLALRRGIALTPELNDPI
jgi:hypothetical protein